eukprot:TRINITY_DN29995_c0_g1_i1.p1 TRINITY_DN29995_c0_g1~~TRINITY_DN29995_c0_g1_i1.p1  ORF type:complete len:828 (+),score=186.81 TRINITY_DN29995_c0_g1_i1:71-2554(+)
MPWPPTLPSDPELLGAVVELLTDWLGPAVLGLLRRKVLPLIWGTPRRWLCILGFPGTAWAVLRVQFQQLTRWQAHRAAATVALTLRQAELCPPRRCREAGANRMLRCLEAALRKRLFLAGRRVSPIDLAYYEWVRQTPAATKRLNPPARSSAVLEGLCRWCAALEHVEACLPVGRARWAINYSLHGRGRTVPLVQLIYQEMPHGWVTLAHWRYWNIRDRVRVCGPTAPDGASIRVVWYNMLAEGIFMGVRKDHHWLADDEGEGYLDCLNWEQQRRPALIRELREHEADLIAVTEIDYVERINFAEGMGNGYGHQHFWRKPVKNPRMRRSASGKGMSPDRDGVSIFWKKDVIEHLGQWHHLELDAVQKLLPELGVAGKDGGTRNVALFGVFRTVVGGIKFVAGATQLYWDPALEGLKRVQADCFQARAWALAQRYGTEHVVLLGDFNQPAGSPGYWRLLRGLDPVHPGADEVSHGYRIDAEDVGEQGAFGFRISQVDPGQIERHHRKGPPPTLVQSARAVGISFPFDRPFPVCGVELVVPACAVPADLSALPAEGWPLQWRYNGCAADAWTDLPELTAAVPWQRRVVRARQWDCACGARTDWRPGGQCGNPTCSLAQAEQPIAREEITMGLACSVFGSFAQRATRGERVWLRVHPDAAESSFASVAGMRLVVCPARPPMRSAYGTYRSRARPQLSADCRLQEQEVHPWIHFAICAGSNREPVPIDDYSQGDGCRAVDAEAGLPPPDGAAPSDEPYFTAYTPKRTAKQGYFMATIDFILHTEGVVTKAVTQLRSLGEVLPGMPCERERSIVPSDHLPLGAELVLPFGHK